MQENLKGRTILVGKEPQKGRLMIAMRFKGQPKTTVIGLEGSVPNTVSRCIVAQNIAHCKIDIAKDGRMTITNMKPQNVTFVNGSEVMKKTIREDSQIALGRDKFVVSLPEILATASKVVDIVCPPPPKVYSILPLKQVWEEYDEMRTAQKIASGRFAALASASGLFTIGSFVLTAIPTVDQNIRYVMYAIAFVLILTTIVKKWYDAKYLPQKQKDEQHQFQSDYVCPNPECHHYVGGLGEYSLLRQNKKCPFCGCKWTEE